MWVYALRLGCTLTAMGSLPASGTENGLQDIRLVHEPGWVPEDLREL